MAAFFLCFLVFVGASSGGSRSASSLTPSASPPPPFGAAAGLPATVPPSGADGLNDADGVLASVLGGVLDGDDFDFGFD